ncbi:lysophospholipid acyltransferase family protein [Pedobacter punctiformis]|uniref:Lysophospholipid acyltransferase family protein n=1 Tax=Pedobacter punctiformis TaxID=3004097 RepID=A0ABT4L4I6_9SPHI|nr:lysophospholipid acyltransferase family protein [Pedobacter sp. HCMS5-2]MCZ4242827.1 lysophospholipid acyltransferase family protein [Pedobacter sp. HCMS5-2]
MRKLVGAIYLLYSALVFFVLMVVVCPFIILATTFLKEKSGKKVSFIFLKFWAWGFSLFTFLWFTSNGKSEVDTSKSYIYVGNHSSFLDAVAIVISIPQAFSPLGKIEMLKVPVFGWIYKRLVVVIDRSSRESRDHSVAELRKDLADGQSILIFPEGTMNKTSKPLTPFFDGAFRLAIETQTPVLPFAIMNSKKHLPRTDPLMLNPGIINTRFGTAIEVKGLVAEDLEMLKEKTYNSILALLNPVSQ